LDSLLTWDAAEADLLSASLITVSFDSSLIFSATAPPIDGNGDEARTVDDARGANPSPVPEEPGAPNISTTAGLHPMAAPRFAAGMLFTMASPIRDLVSTTVSTRLACRYVGGAAFMAAASNSTRLPASLIWINLGVGFHGTPRLFLAAAGCFRTVPDDAGPSSLVSRAKYLSSEAFSMTSPTDSSGAAVR
jgi:hypothetical protein